MELRTLKYFLTVAREENITEAANVLHLTQPTLSRQIADLEKELGVTLFRRTNRRTTLTEEGMHLRQRAAEIMALVSETEDEMRESWTNLEGRIRIGAAEAPTVHYITDTFAALHERYPKITCEIYSGNADIIKYKLEHGLLDFGLFLEPVILDDCEFIRVPETCRTGLAVGAHSPWADYKTITPKNIRDIPLFLTTRTKNPNAYNFKSWSKGKFSEKDLNVIGQADLLGNITYLVDQNVGAAYCVEGIFNSSSNPLKFIPFDPPLSLTTIIAWKSHRLFTHTTETFLNELKKRIEQDSEKLKVKS